MSPKRASVSIGIGTASIPLLAAVHYDTANATGILSELAPFKVIAKQKLATLRQGDLVATNAPIADLETAWDKPATHARFEIQEDVEGARRGHRCGSCCAWSTFA